MLVLLLWLLFAPVGLATPPGPNPVDLNLASVEELQQVPGLGPTKAAAIVKYRVDHGPFKKVNHLERVPGIGVSTLDKLKPWLMVGDLDAAKEAIAVERTQERPPPGPIVDINTATVDELTDLPGIGPSKAQAIFDDRERRGPYKKCRQLERVTGIGPSTVDQLLETCVASRPER